MHDRLGGPERRSDCVRRLSCVRRHVTAVRMVRRTVGGVSAAAVRTARRAVPMHRRNGDSANHVGEQGDAGSEQLHQDKAREVMRG